jgi:formylglycine-generating enzyme required for sulfatase activity
VVPPPPAWASWDKEIVNSIGMKLVLLPPGEFKMGSPEGEKSREEDEEGHDVKLTHAFYMGKYLVTQAQYERVMGGNPSEFNRQNGGGPSHPVEKVNWDQASAFCRKLTQLEAGTGRTYRLPTESEWEYACRAGSSTAYHFGNDPTEMDGHAWYKANAGGRTQPVGRKLPNAFGLFDMHGNVWQWCLDWYEPDYTKLPAVNPTGPDQGQRRVLRGGSWADHEAALRSARRAHYPPSFPGVSHRGFRVVCLPRPNP